jgi:hypothetical protein
MTTEHIFTATDLASRHSAATLRQSLEPKLQAGKVVLDFSGVEAVSESYADELLGVLVATYGLPWVFERLQLKGARPTVARSLTAAIRYRLSLQNRGDLRQPLDTVRDALHRQRLAFA